MRNYHYIAIAVLLIFICTTITQSFWRTSAVAKAKADRSSFAPLSHKASEDLCKTTESKQKKPIIIFDLINVLFQEDHSGFAKKIGYGALASYTITHWKNPGHRCLDMLATISTHDAQKPHVIISLRKRTMPRCIVELYEGKKTCAQTRAEINHAIEKLDGQKYFSSTKEKTLMIAIMNLILDPATVTSVIEPVKQVIQLAQKLKESGHQIYIVANAPKELFIMVEKKFPDILKIFDGVVISSQIKTIKPDHKIFLHLFNTYNLKPAECILIDDLDSTVTAAQKLGMKAIVHDKISHVTHKLKKCGVIF